jgi:hypothetical protein
MGGIQSSVWLQGFQGAVVLEAITCVGRFGLDLQSTRDTSFMAKLTFGLRIHHAYPGALMLLAAMLLPVEAGKRGGSQKMEDCGKAPAKYSFFGFEYTLREWLVVGGTTLFASDMMHHFLVLWPITGDHDFDLTYF